MHETDARRRVLEIIKNQGVEPKQADVTLILVAWHRPKKAGFCGRYGIQFVKKKLER